MKKIMVLILAIVMVFALAACEGEKEPAETALANNASNEVQEITYDNAFTFTLPAGFEFDSENSGGDATAYKSGDTVLVVSFAADLEGISEDLFEAGYLVYVSNVYQNGYDSENASWSNDHVKGLTYSGIIDSQGTETIGVIFDINKRAYGLMFGNQSNTMTDMVGDIEAVFDSIKPI